MTRIFPKSHNLVSTGGSDYTLRSRLCSFYDKPLLTFYRLTETYLTFAPRGFISLLKAIPAWLKDKLFQKSNLITKIQEIDEKFDKKKFLFSNTILAMRHQHIMTSSTKLL